jgi:glycosyltransferase involved in cell wall biosynthesis
MKELFKSTYGPINIEVIPNAIDASWLQPKESDIIENNKTKDGVSIFYHGRLAPEKGVDLLLKAFYNVINERSQIKSYVMLYIAGWGPQKRFLEKMCKDLGIDKNVIFLGHLEQSQIKSYLGSVDAAIYPSIHDAFNIAVLEAFSSVNGPVFYSCNIGINDFVKKAGNTFFTFTPSINELSDVIEFILDKKYDSTIHIKQKEFAEKFTWNKVAKNYIDIYNQMA